MSAVLALLLAALGAFASDVPAPSLSVTARHAFSDRVWVRAKARVVAEDDEPGPTEAETPAHEVVDLAAGASITKSLDVVLGVSNLTDELYPLSADEEAPPAPGRGFSATLQARW